MSDVRYAISDLCGMERIIITAIIQHLDNGFSVQSICFGTPALAFVCHCKRECGVGRGRGGSSGEAG